MGFLDSVKSYNDTDNIQVEREDNTNDTQNNSITESKVLDNKTENKMNFILNNKYIKGLSDFSEKITTLESHKKNLWYWMDSYYSIEIKRTLKKIESALEEKIKTVLKNEINPENIKNDLTLFEVYLELKWEEKDKTESIIKYIKYIKSIAIWTEDFHKNINWSEKFEKRKKEIYTDMKDFFEKWSLNIFIDGINIEIEKVKSELNDLNEEIKKSLEEQEDSVYYSDKSWIWYRYSLTFSDYNHHSISTNSVFEEYQEKILEIPEMENSEIIRIWRWEKSDDGIYDDSKWLTIEKWDNLKDNKEEYKIRKLHLLWDLIDNNYDFYKDKYNEEDSNKLIAKLAEELNIAVNDEATKMFNILKNQLWDWSRDLEIEINDKKETITFKNEEEKNKKILSLMYFYKWFAEDPETWWQHLANLLPATIEIYKDINTIIWPFLLELFNYNEILIIILWGLPALYFGTNIYARWAMPWGIDRIWANSRIDNKVEEYKELLEKKDKWELTKTEDIEKLDKYEKDKTFLERYKRFEEIEKLKKLYESEWKTWAVEALDSFKKWNLAKWTRISLRHNDYYNQQLSKLLDILDHLEWEKWISLGKSFWKLIYNFVKKTTIVWAPEIVGQFYKKKEHREKIDKKLKLYESIELIEEVKIKIENPNIRDYLIEKLKEQKNIENWKKTITDTIDILEKVSRTNPEIKNVVNLVIFESIENNTNWKVTDVRYKEFNTELEKAVEIAKHSQWLGNIIELLKDWLYEKQNEGIIEDLYEKLELLKKVKELWLKETFKKVNIESIHQALNFIEIYEGLKTREKTDEKLENLKKDLKNLGNEEINYSKSEVNKEIKKKWEKWFEEVKIEDEEKKWEKINKESILKDNIFRSRRRAINLINEAISQVNDSIKLSGEDKETIKDRLIEMKDKIENMKNSNFGNTYEVEWYKSLRKFKNELWKNENVDVRNFFDKFIDSIKEKTTEEKTTESKERNTRNLEKYIKEADLLLDRLEMEIIIKEWEGSSKIAEIQKLRLQLWTSIKEKLDTLKTYLEKDFLDWKEIRTFDEIIEKIDMEKLKNFEWLNISKVKNILESNKNNLEKFSEIKEKGLFKDFKKVLKKWIKK